MAEQMEPGPELDAKLAEAMGKGRDVRVRATDEYVRVYSDNPYLSDGALSAHNLRHYGACPRYSTDPSAAISAAEECRKAGSAIEWLISRTSIRATATVVDKHGKHCHATGSSPAHALVLALLAALTPALTGEK